MSQLGELHCDLHAYARVVLDQADVGFERLAAGQLADSLQEEWCDVGARDALLTGLSQRSHNRLLRQRCFCCLLCGYWHAQHHPAPDFRQACHHASHSADAGKCENAVMVQTQCCQARRTLLACRRGSAQRSRCAA